MRTVIHPLILLVILVAACHSPGKTGKEETAAVKKPTFVFKETLVTGKDTGMNRLTGFQKIEIHDVLSQRWILDEDKAPSLAWDDDNNRLFPELILFRDLTVMDDPRLDMQMGTWKVSVVDKVPVLTLTFPGKKIREYIIVEIKSQVLVLKDRDTPDEDGYIPFVSDGLVHQDMHNDPFHPINNQWRIRPAKPESDSLIKARAKQCLKFYALFYRDNIKRHKDDITFHGLPQIFEWYRRGIGLPDREDVDESWINCFYNKEQALKGYNLLRRLIVDYEFNWPEGAPTWVHETHSVLEQMYARF